ncbi:7-cyano-7-deazaguanine synthase QueC [candidate division FCPU426 bacterium]|nr:7-cyano-7-deazaguanine synthase QueC [candidate division FCPU426 bacterium]
MSAFAGKDSAAAAKAVVLLSGGLDSAVTLAYAAGKGYACHALTLDYGQRHRVEIQCAQKTAAVQKAAEHKIIRVDLGAIGGSALTADIPVPDARPQSGGTGGIPVTYVPARNTVFLSLALAWAEVLRAKAIFIGANSVDYSGYPDCRPEYLQAFAHLAALATQAGVVGDWKVEIQAPLVQCTKAEIITLGKKMGVDFSLTSSCYRPRTDGRPCGTCESCGWRRKGFAEAGEQDPALGPRM